jgi:hypothetical protein
MSRVFWLLVLGACGSAANEKGYVAVERGESTPLEIFLLDPFNDPSGHSLLGNDIRERIVQRFGEPLDTSVRLEVDRYGSSGSQDRYTTMHYDDLTFVVGDRPGQQVCWLSTIELSGKRHALKYGLSTGVSRQYVLDQLKPANYSSEPTRLVIFQEVWEKGFRGTPEEDQQVTASIILSFQIDGEDRVSKITWKQSGH